MTNYSQIRNSKSSPPSPSPSRGEGRGGDRGFTLIEIIVVIVILSIASAITIKFLVDSLSVYTMTVNQKTLFDEGKLALERMCRDIRDAQSLSVPNTGSSGPSITFKRTNKTAQDNAGDIIIFQTSSGTLQKQDQTRGDNPGWAMASNVTVFTVTRGAPATNNLNEIQLQLTLQSAFGGTPMKVALQTKVYPKNLVKDLTYLNFYSNWMEAYQ